MKSKGKRQKAKGKNAELSLFHLGKVGKWKFFIFAFCLLPFAFCLVTSQQRYLFKQG
jgi:hypothetical protein